VAGRDLEEGALVEPGLADATGQVEQAEAAHRARPAVAQLEVPGPLDTGVGRSGVDRRKRQAGPVVVQIAVLVEPRLAGEALRRVRVPGARRVDPMTGTDLEPHAFVEEDVAVLPELRRQQILERREVLDAERLALARPRRYRVLALDRRVLRRQRRTHALGRNARRGATRG